MRSAERNRRTPMREDASDSKDDGGERNQPGHNGPLTAKLSGRSTPPDQRRERTLFSRARGAVPLAPHGPLERLLEGSLLKAHTSIGKTPTSLIWSKIVTTLKRIGESPK